MVKDAAGHAAEDKERRDLIDARNQADSLGYQVEKLLNENREKLPVGELSRIDAALAEVRRAAEGENLDALKRATASLEQASHGLAELLYKGSQGSRGSQGSPGSRGSQGSSGSPGSQGSGVKDGEVVDAEFAETV
jgi:molecular chaperone DnaK